MKNTFDGQIPERLLQACTLEWGQLSPVMLGSMFQALLNPQERRNVGAHYTSEQNIQKLIKPLFLDELYNELARAKGNKTQLQALHKKLATLRFLDPACGCGNFLVITYRELRELELQVLRELNKSGQGFLDIREIIHIDVDQFYGIESDEFACQITQVALWLIDHQMNLKVSHEFGQYFVRLPLTKVATIVHGNALRMDWESLVSKTQLHYILGNPPFVGKQLQNAAQKADMESVFTSVPGAGVLDYVTAWYLTAAKYIQDTTIRCAFVSTNSIAQGEQVGVLWNELYHRYHLKIHFAHRTFSWRNEAKGNAAVHCVIIGFGVHDRDDKRLFDYENLKGEPTERQVKNINPYLVEGSDIFITKRTKPLCQVSEIKFGNQPIDGGGFIIETREELAEILSKEPTLSKYIRKYVGSQEYLNKIDRWVFWLLEISPTEIRNSKILTEKISRVKEFRSKSSRKETRELALVPTKFAFISHTETDYVIIPSVSSENRRYIPIGVMPKEVITSNLCLIIPNATLFLFGILTSEMHLAWVKYTCGRLKSDFRYSNTIVYNNYPFPQNVNEVQKQKVEQAAQKVLDTRTNYPDNSLADLYDPLSMPPDLVKVHQALDKAVDVCYRSQAFTNELGRIEYLFSLYEQLTAPMIKVAKKRKTTKATKA